MPTLDELRRRGHSYRNFDPYEVANLMDESGRGEGRQFLGWVESGRMQPMLKATFDFYVPLDPDERKMFWRRNPDLMRWTVVYAISEHLNTLTQFKPDDVTLWKEGSAPGPLDIA